MPGLRMRGTPLYVTQVCPHDMFGVPDRMTEGTTPVPFFCCALRTAKPGAHFATSSVSCSSSGAYIPRSQSARGTVACAVAVAGKVRGAFYRGALSTAPKCLDRTPEQ